MEKISKLKQKLETSKNINSNNSKSSTAIDGGGGNRGGVLYMNDKTIAQFEAMEKFIWNYQDDLMIQDAFNARNNNLNRTISNEIILKILV